MPAVSTSCSNCAKGAKRTRKGAKNDEAVQEKDEVGWVARCGRTKCRQVQREHAVQGKGHVVMLALK